jgi:hypothetical protein
LPSPLQMSKRNLSSIYEDVNCCKLESKNECAQILNRTTADRARRLEVNIRRLHLLSWLARWRAKSSVQSLSKRDKSAQRGRYASRTHFHLCLTFVSYNRMLEWIATEARGNDNYLAPQAEARTIAHIAERRTLYLKYRTVHQRRRGREGEEDDLSSRYRSIFLT